MVLVPNKVRSSELASPILKVLMATATTTWFITKVTVQKACNKPSSIQEITAISTPIQALPVKYEPAKAEKTPIDLFTAEAQVHLPVACIPTTAGTGSELTPYAILTKSDERTKASIPQRIWPVFSVIDPRYFKSMNRKLLVTTGLDAMMHLLESSLSSKANFFSDDIVRLGLQHFAKSRELFQTERENDEALNHLIDPELASVSWGNHIDFESVNRQLLDYRSWLIQFGVQFSCPVIDFQTGFSHTVIAIPDKDWYLDGLHPTALGNEIMVKSLPNKLYKTSS